MDEIDRKIVKHFHCAPPGTPKDSWRWLLAEAYGPAEPVDTPKFLRAIWIYLAIAIVCFFSAVLALGFARSCGPSVLFAGMGALCGGGALSLLRARRKHRSYRWLITGHCPNCGYDLRASKNRCPECGGSIPQRPAE